jgi:NAD(P)H-flavin reductase
MTEVKEFKAKILKIDDFTDEKGNSCKVYRLSTEKANGFEFKAGQFVMISHDDFKLWNNPKELKWASFSICSSPLQKGFIELCLRIHSTPGLTNFIGKNLREGNELNVKGPFGVFTLKEPFKELMFIALGTGIAPLLSMIRTLILKKDERPIKLFFGFRNSKQFVFQKELEELASKAKNFKFYPIISEEDPHWKGEKGFVQDLIKKAKFENDKKEVDIYVCGPPKAVDSIIEFLKEQGFNENKIHREKW